MPYKSAKQMRYLHSQKPEVAARFDKDIKSEQRSSSRKASGSAATPKSGKPAIQKTAKKAKKK